MNKNKNKWVNDALYLLREFVVTKKEFMCEDFRSYCNGQKLTKPGNDRAFGAVILKGVREGIIKRVGYGTVKNARAHATPAAIWKAA